MPSIIPGFEYDIFISYRQKDNKGDRWVSEFVDDLKIELESTFKEEISLYFDVNPHDGLLETHDVHASLSEKLRCVIFIPVISRTYCDPRSFAWEQEFKAFVAEASEDRFGLKIKLANGNVANRVLPIIIYDLDESDIKECESVLGGALRGVEFIYRSSGVNRPLRSREENPRENLNRTFYRDQINKVANAIKEIISGLETKTGEKDKGKDEYILSSQGSGKGGKVDTLEKPVKVSGKKIFARSVIVTSVLVCIAALLFIVCIVVYPKVFLKERLDKLRSSDGRISVVVMPFQNMSNDTTLNIWQDGIQFNLISSFSNSQNLSVRQSESTNSLIRSKGYTDYALITSAVAKTISQNLDANVFIVGNISQAGGNIRINAQLIEAKTNNIFKSFKVDGEAGRIFQITDSLSSLIKSYLIISSLKNEITNDLRSDAPSSVEAFKSYILGNKAFVNYDYQSAIKWFSQAIKIDSNYAASYIWLSLSCANQGQYDQAEKWARKVYEMRDQLPLEQQVMVNWICAKYVEKSNPEEIKYARQYLEFNDKLPIRHWMVGLPYYEMNQYDNAIPEFEAAIRIYKSWNTRPMNGSFYQALISAYHDTGRYREEKELLKEALEAFPEDLSIIRRQIIYSLTVNDTITAKQYINKAISISKDISRSDAEIVSGLAGIYSDAGLLNKAERLYREAVSMEPENALRLNDLAYFLIDKNINVNEGMEFIGKVHKSESSVNWTFEDTRAWGLHKLGRDKEALEILQKSWDRRPRYNYTLYLHLQEVKKALAR